MDALRLPGGAGEAYLGPTVDPSAEGMTPTPGTEPHIVDALARAAKRHRVARKLLLAPNLAAGRELLRLFSRRRGGWIGFEVTTPRPLALRLARAAMEQADLSTLDAFEEQALVDQALDSALAGDGGRFARLSEGVGFREKVHEAVAALRLASVAPEALERARLRDRRKQRFLVRVLRRYERMLTERGRADTAAVFALGVAALERVGGVPPELGAELVLVMPGLGTRGLAGRLVSALCSHGARVLETDPVLGLEHPDAVVWNRRRPPAPGSLLHAPTWRPAEGDEEIPEAERLEVHLFRAGSVYDELREVLRRVAERGLRWDQVEVVTADPSLHGSALHALSTRLSVPVTYAVGLPIERTRTGRVVRAYLDWIEEGFQAGPIRRLIEAGDLRPRAVARDRSPSDLARRFRSLRIGWGRKRYRTQILAAIESVDAWERRRHETDEGFERRRERARAELTALKSMLFPALKATPTVPDRLGAGGGPVSPSELARGLRAFLRRVPKGRGPDRVAREDVGRVLERIEATLRRRTEFRSAVSILRRHLELRVRAGQPGADPEGRGAPWSSQGGALHLSDFEHGGYTGREATFVIGLDSDRVPGPVTQDPMLLDTDRRVIDEALPTSAELVHERAFRVAALFARLRGSVTLAYTAWNASEARLASPSPLLLQALRLARRDATLTFEDLDEALGPVVASVPRPGRPALDADDVWMGALGDGGVLRTGVEAVRAAFPRLDRGVASREQRLHGTAHAVHGVVTARPEALDPRRNPSVVVSASRLEALGRCPLKYLHETVLRVRSPDDPELDPVRWLDPLRRGGVLHGVYQGALQRARDEGVAYDDAGFERLALEELARGLECARDETPVPGEGTLRREVAGLEEDVRSFVRMVRDRGAEWIALELTFGLGDDEPLPLPLEGGTVHVRGAIDRVDEDLGGMRVIDYKTGRLPISSGSADAFAGGRRLQHALYAQAADAALGGMVVAGEYHYPTRRGENQVVVFDRMRLAGVGTLVGLMLDGVAAGAFVPTNASDDCTFCDYAAICRVRREEWGGTSSPLADWSQEHLNTGLDPALAHLRRVREFES